jgi:hypothetical protein
MAASTRTTTGAWIVLSAITVISWRLSPGHAMTGQATASVPITVAVVLLAAAKGRLVIRRFMEVASAPRWLRFATDGWLLILWAAVLGIYLI